VREADNLTTFTCRISWKSGSRNFLETSGPHRACYWTALPLKPATQAFRNLRKRSQPISMVVRPTAWVYGPSLPGITGSNPAGGMDVCLLCVVRRSSLLRTDHSSRRVPPTVVCLSVIMRPR